MTFIDTLTRAGLCGLFIILAPCGGSSPGHAAPSARVVYDNAPFNNQPTTKISGELKTPDGAGPFPAVVVLQACGGLGDHVTVDWPKFLNEIGFAALVIDILGSRKVANACTGNPIPLDERMRDIYGALAFLAENPAIDASRLYAIGFSWGGTHVLESLLERRPGQFASGEKHAVLKGGIAVYPGCEGIYGAITQRNVKPNFYAPLLIVAAELDDWTPVSQCQTVIAGQQQPGRASIVIMPDAQHGFDQLTANGTALATRKAFGHTLSPSRAATDKTRMLTKDFLTHLE